MHSAVGQTDQFWVAVALVDEHVLVTDS